MEGFSTFFTFIRSLSSMNSLVLSKSRALTRVFYTFLTFIRFLSSVNSLMTSKT